MTSHVYNYITPMTKFISIQNNYKYSNFNYIVSNTNLFNTGIKKYYSFTVNKILPIYKNRFYSTDPTGSPKEEPKGESTQSNQALDNKNEVKEKNKKTKATFVPISWRAVFFLLIIGTPITLFLVNLADERKRAGKSTIDTEGKPEVGGPWTLIDHNGIAVNSYDLEGKFYLLYFGFTYCPDICPQELNKVVKVINSIEKADLGDYLQPYFVTIDPSRDSVGQLRSYLQDFHPKLIGLTGTPEQIDKMAKLFRVYYTIGTQLSTSDYIVDHSAITYIMDNNNNFVKIYTNISDPEAMSLEIIKYMKEGLGKKTVWDRITEPVVSMFKKLYKL